MLTVMHRHDTGDETIYQAAMVSKDVAGNVILRGCPATDHYGPGAVVRTPGMIELSAGCRSSLGITPMAFVMNEAGATVARHTL